MSANIKFGLQTADKDFKLKKLSNYTDEPEESHLPCGQQQHLSAMAGAAVAVMTISEANTVTHSCAFFMLKPEWYIPTDFNPAVVQCS